MLKGLSLKFEQFLSLGKEINLSSLKTWLGKGFWAVADQGLFSLANFLVNILLARWLEPEAYGAYAVALSIYYLLLNVHSALLTEPMMVFGAGRYQKNLYQYLKLVLFGHWGLSALISLILGAAAIGMKYLGKIPMANALGGLAIAFPFLLFFWIIRRVPYIEIYPQRAVFGSFLNLLFTLIFLYILQHLSFLSILSALIILGTAGFLSSLVLWFLYYRANRIDNTAVTIGAVKKEHWEYGKWSLPTVILMWIPGNIYFSLLPIVSGLDSSASLRALHNLVLPLLHTYAAISTLLLPFFSSAYWKNKNIGSRVFVALVVYVVPAFLFWIALSIVGTNLIAILYNGKYVNDAHLLTYLALLPITAGIVSVIGGALRAMEKPNLVFRSYVFTTASAVLIGIPLVFLYGLVGAVIGQLVSSGTTAVAMIWFYTQHRKRGANK